MRHLYSIPKLISCLVDNRIHHMGIQGDSRPEIFGNKLFLVIIIGTNNYY